MILLDKSECEDSESKSLVIVDMFERDSGSELASTLASAALYSESSAVHVLPLCYKTDPLH